MAGAIGFSGKAILVKLSYLYGVDAVQTIFFRMALALPFFIGLAGWAGRGQARLTSRQGWMVLSLGFSGYYLASMLDFLGLQYITASLERLILYITPTIVILITRWRFGRQAPAAQWVGMAISYIGVLLVFGHELSLDGWSTAWGGTLVFLSTLSYAYYLIYSGEVVKELGSMRLVGWASSVACVFCMIQLPIVHPLSALVVPWEVLGLAAINALFCTVAPVLLVMLGIERIGAGLASQVGMIGPISTIALGILILGEPFNAWIGAGTVMVIAGVTWASMSAKRSTPKATSEAQA